MKQKLILAGVALMAVAGGSACSTGSQMASARPATPNVLSRQDVAEGWRLLFDGRTTTGWREFRKPSISSGWQVVDGSLVRVADGAGDIITNEQFRNFEFALEWNVSEGGNSGIFYRVNEQADIIWQAAAEMQVLDDARHQDGKSDLTSAGASYGLYPAPRGVVRPAGQWNEARLVVNGDHTEHWLNGVKLLEYERGSADWKDRVAKSKFSTMPLYGIAKQGHIGLQDHGDRVAFRNIRIRVLP
ncbi:MAG: DUF1080 domain-containing protein [Gemmatimonadaceae bacterium]